MNGPINDPTQWAEFLAHLKNFGFVFPGQAPGLICFGSACAGKYESGDQASIASDSGSVVVSNFSGGLGEDVS